jgi:biopolymer transport protein ExbB
MDFIEFIQNNLAHVLPILIAAVFAVVIIAERTRALTSVYPLKDSKLFFEKLSELIVSGRTNEAVSLCDQFPKKPAARIVKAGLLRAHLPDEAVEQALAISLGEATRLVSRRTSFLATIANVATLLGLFGTIAGLIQSFEAVGHADAQQKAAMLSAGIATAMNATMMGLAVAIPCMVAFSVLVNKSNALVGDLEDSALKTMDTLKLRYYLADAPEALNESARPPSRANGTVTSLEKTRKTA